MRRLLPQGNCGSKLSRNACLRRGGKTCWIQNLHCGESAVVKHFRTKVTLPLYQKLKQNKTKNQPLKTKHKSPPACLWEAPRGVPCRTWVAPPGRGAGPAWRGQAVPPQAPKPSFSFQTSHANIHSPSHKQQRK